MDKKSNQLPFSKYCVASKENLGFRFLGFLCSCILIGLLQATVKKNKEQTCFLLHLILGSLARSI